MVYPPALPGRVLHYSTWPRRRGSLLHRQEFPSRRIVTRVTIHEGPKSHGGRANTSISDAIFAPSTHRVEILIYEAHGRAQSRSDISPFYFYSFSLSLSFTLLLLAIPISRQPFVPFPLSPIFPLNLRRLSRHSRKITTRYRIFRSGNL